jgi:hypothetical protein
MNLFIQEKIFTYCYNKFRPVNRMQYIKYDVNSSLLTYFWLLQKVCGTINHCFITTHYSQWEWYITNLLLCDIPRNKEPRTGPLHIWHTYKLYAFFGHEKNTHGSGGLLISLASVCYGDSRVAKHLLRPHLFFRPICGWGDLGYFQLPQSHETGHIYYKHLALHKTENSCLSLYTNNLKTWPTNILHSELSFLTPLCPLH